MQGTPVVWDNTPSNLYLPENKKITITSIMDTGARIGLTCPAFVTTFKRKELPWKELDRDQLEKVNGGMLPIIHNDPDDDDQDSDSSGGVTGGW